MKELLDKLTTYNLFNYLLPGILFCVILTSYTSFNFFVDSAIMNLFICYFSGLVISRVGSLFLEPFLKYISFLKFAPYKDFVEAGKADSKLDLLSEANNMYRTISVVFFLLLLAKLYELLGSVIYFFFEYSLSILIVLLLFLFLLSYRKQTNYIKSRVDSHFKR